MCLQMRGWAPSIQGAGRDMAWFLLAAVAEDFLKLVLAAPWGVSRDLTRLCVGSKKTRLVSPSPSNTDVKNAYGTHALTALFRALTPYFN